MFEQSFKNIDDILNKDAGCGRKLDYVEQSSWILFLSWVLDVSEIDQKTFDLSVKNPNKTDNTELRSPAEILEEIKSLDRKSAKALERIHQLSLDRKSAKALERIHQLF